MCPTSSIMSSIKKHTSDVMTDKILKRKIIGLILVSKTVPACLHYKSGKQYCKQSTFLFIVKYLTHDMSLTLVVSSIASSTGNACKEML